MEAADKDCKTTEETKKQEAVNALHKPSKQNRAVKPTTDPCYRCGRKGHQPQNCRFREAQCHNCGKTGHIAVACRNKIRSQKTQSTMQKHVELDSEDDEEEELSQLNNLEERDIQLLSSKPLMEVRINGQRVRMEIDTDAAVSVISQKNQKIPLKKTAKQLRSATGQVLELAGEAKVKVRVKGMKKMVKIYVAKGECPLTIWSRVD